MSVLAEKLKKAIEAKMLKAHEASTYTYDEAGVMEMDPESMEWQVRVRDGNAWVADQTGDSVALASEVDRCTESWDPIPRGRLEFMADNDPTAVLRVCAGHYELLDHYWNRVAKYRHLKSLQHLTDEQVSELRTVEALIADYAAVILPALARGYGLEVEA